MRTEFLKIIEGGLERNPEKVKNYAKLVSDKFREDGEEKFADRITNLLSNKSIHPVYLDEFVSKPIDKDSRLPMVDVSIVSNTEKLILPTIVEEKVKNYINSLDKRDQFIKLGLNMPESLLLFGPPGCGKTSIAHYISEKTGLPLVTAKLDGLISSLLGSTAKNIRKIFEYAEERPCILFLDEFDAIAKARDDSHEVGELKRVVNSLLQNIDTFNQNNILIAATNHEKLLDNAVWRRFTNVMEIPKPTVKEIPNLIRQYTDSFETDFLDDSKKMKTLSNIMLGLSPSDIKTICYNAIKRSIITEKDFLTYPLFLYQCYISNGYNNDISMLIHHLSDHGVSQINISKTLDISQRQVRNTLKEKADDNND
ncbi:ATP-binding protein [Bacillaceae bacterium IKA-2]|nr:ATP-binding protein [Bacillaceae bacterium IKA-2]